MMLLLFLLLVLSGTDACADIYRYTNEEGVECFTDTPTVPKAVKVMRENRVSRRNVPKQARPASHTPAGAARKGPAACPAPEPELTDTTSVLPVAGRITSPVGLRHDPIDGVLRDHKGVDIATPEGTPVQPVAPGVVIFSGYRSGYGNTVVVRHADGMTTLYAHNSINLKSEGEPVDRGSTIAFSGSTGRSTGPHLHFEAWKDGINLTATFIPGAAAPHDLGRESDEIRRFVQADGTIRFTNLP